MNSKRVFTISSEYRDIDRAIKPDLLHPSTLDRILTMENQDGTTVCADLLNQPDKKYQHKRSKPKKHYYAVTKTATIAADIGIPTSEEAKVAKVLATSPMQLEKMLFKDYYGTRVGRKNSPPELHMIYNFDNWLQVRVCKEDPDKVVGRTIYYYNPSEMRPLEMNAFAKTIWTQKSVYVPVRFGMDVVPLQPSSSSTAITTPVDVNASLQDWQKEFEDKIFGRLNDWTSQYQQQNVNTGDNGYTFEELPESMNVSYLSRKGSVAGVTGSVDLKVNTVRKLLKKIWRGRQATYNSRVDGFFKICKKNNWDPDKVLDAGKIKNTKDLDDNDKEVIRLICNPYYRDSDENWWNLVRTGADLRRPEKTGAEPVPNIQSSPTGIVEQQDARIPAVPTGVSVPPQNETVSLDQQPAQPVQQPVQQPAQTPEQSQPAQSVFTDQQQPVTQQEQPQQDEQTSNVVHIDNMQDPDLSYDEYIELLYTCFGILFTSSFVQNKFKDFINTGYPFYYDNDVLASVIKILINNNEQYIVNILNGFFKILEKDIDKLNKEQQNAFYNAMVYVKKLLTARHTQKTATATAF